MSLPPVLANAGPPVEATQDERTMALLVHLSIFLGAIIAPLIVYAVKKDSSPYVAYHALQALLFQVAVLAVNMLIILPVASILTTFSFGLCTPVFCLALVPLFGAIPLAMRASRGEWKGYPLLTQVGRPPGV